MSSLVILAAAAVSEILHRKTDRQMSLKILPCDYCKRG